MRPGLLVLLLLSCLSCCFAASSSSGQSSLVSNCTQTCNCTRVRNGLYRVRCNNKVLAVTSLGLEPVASMVSHLDLSKSLIQSIGPRELVNFTNLKKLDLSSNHITTLSGESFEGLKSLEILKLNHNNLTTFEKGTLYGLLNLKKLDISNNSLECDCNLLLIVEWARNLSVKLSPMPKCSSPPHLRGAPLSQLYDDGFLSCHNLHKHSLDILKLHPQQDQVVFEGDRLKLQCQTQSEGLENPSINWFWGQQDPSSIFEDVHIDSQQFKEKGLLHSSLIIDRLSSSHAGQWNCLLVSGQTNHSRTVSVVVISDDTKYCPQTVLKSNKGVFAWPRTVIGFTAELPCSVHNHGVPILASQECGKDGYWHSLNTSACPFASETTRHLQDFSRMNLTEDHGPAIMESAQRLHNLSAGPPAMTDKMDVIFLSRAILNYLKFWPKEKELGPLVVDMVSFAMELPRGALRAAQEEDQACSKLVHSVEMVAQHTPSLQSQRSNLAVGEFRVSHESFLGITCVWYAVSADGDGTVVPNAPSSRLFHCTLGNNTALLSNKEKVMEASVQVPASLFYQLESQGMPVLPSHQLLIAMYENSNLFPRPEANDTNNRWDVASCVIGSKLVGMKVLNLTDPLIVVVRAPAVREAGGWARPVWWDEDMNGGTGGWSQHGCVLSHLMHGMLVFRCDRFGYFGLLQEVPYQFEHRNPRGLANLSHPAVYAGTLILVICLLVAIVTYVAAGPSIQMPKRTKHAIINTWIAISLLCFMFSVGIHQTDDVELCQCVGLILHYLTLSTLLWMAITVSNMRRRLKKRHPLDLGSDDDLPPSPPTPKPLLGLYLVGWGVGLMVVGVSGAVNLKQYRYFVQDEYCFLAPSPALGAVVVPCCAVVIYLLVCVLLVRCDIAQRNGDTNAQLSDGTQGTENVDLELLDCAVPVHPEVGSVSVVSAASSEVEDAEHTPATQLRAALIVLLLFVSLWAAGALSTATQLHSLLPHAELIFGTLYALTATLLAAFILFFHCFARSDVRPCWQGVRCRARHVSDTHPLPPSARTKPGVEVKVSSTDVDLKAPVLVPVSVSNHMSSSTSINSNKSRNLEAAVELNKTVENGGPNAGPHINKVSNLHMMPMYQSFPNVTDAEMFYNARQSDMARKFFRKQRRQAAFQHNQLGARRRGDGGGDQSDLESTLRDSLRDSLRGSRSKVSNTNIHVEQPGDDLNPNHVHSRNILAEEMSAPTSIERWVIGADSPPQVNNDGSLRISTPDPVQNPLRGSASSRRSRSSCSRRGEKAKNNETMSSLSTERSRNWEAEVAPVPAPRIVSPVSYDGARFPCESSSVVSETESDLRSVSRPSLSRRSSRSPRARKRSKRASRFNYASHPTSLASSALSIHSKDFQSQCNGRTAREVAADAHMNVEDDHEKYAVSKKETCV